LKRLSGRLLAALPFASLVRYGLVGGTAAVVDITLFAIFAKWLGFDYLVVATFSFLLATLVNYVLSIRFVFESGVRFDRYRETTLVYVVSGVGYLVNQAVLYTCVELFGIELMLSKVSATAVVFFWNFGMRSQLIFKARNVTADTVHPRKP